MKTKTYKGVIDSLNFSSSNLEDLFADKGKYKIIPIKGIGVFEASLWLQTFGKSLTRNIVEAKMLETYTGLSLCIKRFSTSKDRQTLEVAGLHAYNEKSKYRRELLKGLWNSIQNAQVTRVDIAIDVNGKFPKEVLMALKKTRHSFKWHSSTYMKSEKEKKSNPRINIILYPKDKKEHLENEITRLEFSFRGGYFNKLKVKDIESVFPKMQKTMKRFTELNIKIEPVNTLFKNLL